MSGLKCPRCGSPNPKLHPAVQLGGEVSICMDSFHGPLPETAKELADRKVAADLARIFLGNDCTLADDIRSGKLARHFAIDLVREHRLRNGGEQSA